METRWWWPMMLGGLFMLAVLVAELFLAGVFVSPGTLQAKKKAATPRKLESLLVLTGKWM